MVDGIQYKLYLQGQQAIKRNLQRTTKKERHDNDRSVTALRIVNTAAAKQQI